MSRLGPLRSILFVPGNRPERIDKAMVSEADAIIIDLEDAVPVSEKAMARETAARRLSPAGDRKVLVRINGTDTAFYRDDLEAVVKAGLSGLMVPKVEDERSILHLHELMHTVEVRKKLGPVPILATIESAKGVANVTRIAQTATDPPRLHTLVFGAADYTSDLCVEMTKGGEELAYPRARVAVACRAAGLYPPIDTPFMLDLKDLQALEVDAMRGRQLGFCGKFCIHPNQIDIINRTFSPRPEEIRHAQAVVRAFEESEAKGLGAIQVGGKFVDKPVVERARQILLLASQLECGG